MGWCCESQWGRHWESILKRKSLLSDEYLEDVCYMDSIFDHMCHHYTGTACKAAGRIEGMPGQVHPIFVVSCEDLKCCF